MLFRRTYGVAILVGLILGGLVMVQVFSILDLPGSESVSPRERGTGTRCAQGDRDACFDLCVALSDVSTLRCVQQLTRVFPIEAEGGGSSSGLSPPSQNGGEPSSGSTRPSPEPPQGPQGPPGDPGPPGSPGGTPIVPTVPDICTQRPLPPVCLDLP